MTAKTQSCYVPNWERKNFNDWVKTLPTPYSLKEIVEIDAKWEKRKELNSIKNERI